MFLIHQCANLPLFYETRRHSTYLSILTPVTGLPAAASNWLGYLLNKTRQQLPTTPSIKRIEILFQYSSLGTIHVPLSLLAASPRMSDSMYNIYIKLIIIFIVWNMGIHLSNVFYSTHVSCNKYCSNTSRRQK